MVNLERRFPEYEIISTEERVRRDPRGLARVTLLSDGFVLVEKQAPADSAELATSPMDFLEAASKSSNPGRAAVAQMVTKKMLSNEI